MVPWHRRPRSRRMEFVSLLSQSRPGQQAPVDVSSSRDWPRAASGPALRQELKNAQSCRRPKEGILWPICGSISQRRRTDRFLFRTIGSANNRATGCGLCPEVVPAFCEDILRPLLKTSELALANIVENWLVFLETLAVYLVLNLHCSPRARALYTLSECPTAEPGYLRQRGRSRKHMHKSCHRNLPDWLVHFEATCDRQRRPSGP